MSKTFKLRLTKGSELTYVELDNNQSILLESASLTYSSASISGNTLKLFSVSSTGSITPITHSYEIVSSSYAVTASYAISSSVEVTKEVSSSNADTASYFAEGIVTASAANNIITFTKDDSSNFNVTIDTGSLKAGLLSSSAQIAEDISGSLSNVAISALNAGIVSASAQVRDRLVVASTFSSASNKAIRDTLDLNQFILSGSKPDADTLRLHPAGGTALDYVVGGGTDDRVDGLLLESGSVKSRLNTIEAITGSILNATSSYALKTEVSGSGDVRFEALNSITGSLIKNAALSGSTTNTIRFTKQDNSTIDVTIATSSVSTDGLFSSSAQVDGAQLGANKNITIAGTSVNLGSSISLSTINAGSNIVSSSGLSNPDYGQGLIRHQINGGDPADIQVSNLSKTDSPVFDGITISGSTNFGSGSNSNSHLFTGSVYISGGLHLGGGGAIGNDITGAFWQGYQISSSKIDFAAGAGNSLNEVLNKKFEKATFDNTSVELTLTNATGSTTLSTIDNRITGLLSATSSYATKLGLGIVSASVLSSPSQGTIRLATNGVNIDVDSGLQAGDSPTFAGLTINGDITANKLTTNIVTSSIAFTSGSNKFGDESTDKHMFTGSVAISGGLDIDGYEVTNAHWKGYVISASKVIHRTVSVDTDGDGSADETLGQSETLMLKKGSNVTLTEAAGVVTIAASNDNVRTVAVDTDGDDSVNNTLATSEDLVFKKGSNITLSEAAGVITISAANDNVRTVGVDTDGDDSVDNTLETSEDLVFKKGSNVTLSEAAGVVTIAAANSFRTVKVDTDGDDTADNTLGASETLTFKKGSNVTLSEAGGVITIAAANDNVRTVGVDTDGDDSVNNTLLTSEDLVFKKGSNITLSEAAGVVTIAASNTNQLTTFQVEDGDGTEVTISHGKEWKFVEGTGININWTDTDNGTDGDPYDLTIENTAPMTGDEFDADGTFASLRAQGTTKGDVGLGNVEDTALSTYTGNGGALDNQYITNGAGYTTATGTVDTTGTVNANEFPQFHDGNTLKALTAAEMRTALNVENGADVTDSTNVKSNLPAGVPSGSASAARSQIGAGTGTVDTSGTPANKQIPIFTDANTISGSSHLRMHVNSGYPQFGGLIVGDGPDSNLYIGAAIEPTSADVGIRLHSTASGDFYFDFQGDATQTLYFRDYDGSGGSPTKFTFDFQNSDFETNTGTFSGNVTANNFVTTSDRELKKDIEPIKEGLETLKQFVSYEYQLDGKKDAGFIAQEVQESLPYAVHTKKDGYLALDTKPIIAHIHKAILEIDQRLSAIEEKLK